MSMKDGKREYRVDWIELGSLYSRWYYKEADAKNYAFKLKNDQAEIAIVHTQTNKN